MAGDIVSHERYFTMLFWHPSATFSKREPVARVPFSNSQMGRDLLHLQASWHGVPVDILTSHLESLQHSREIRMEQLENVSSSSYSIATLIVLQALQILEQAAGFAVFSGDTNLRNDEAEAVLAQHSAIRDVWETAGRNTSLEHTWHVFGRNERYDRAYFTGLSPAAIPTFELVGRGLSDHDGVFMGFPIETLNS